MDKQQRPDISGGVANRKFIEAAAGRSGSLQTSNRLPYPQRSTSRASDYRRAYDPFRCSYCNSPRALTAFANVYSTGSSLSKYRKGLFLKTGWAETRKQSVLAMQCAPQKKRRIWWPLLLVLCGLGFAHLSSLSELLAPFEAKLNSLSICCVAAGSIATVVSLLWNRIYYPKKMQSWENSYYCKRCSRVTVLTPQQR